MVVMQYCGGRVGALVGVGLDVDRVGCLVGVFVLSRGMCGRLDGDVTEPVGMAVGSAEGWPVGAEEGVPDGAAVCGARLEGRRVGGDVLKLGRTVGVRVVLEGDMILGTDDGEDDGMHVTIVGVEEASITEG